MPFNIGMPISCHNGKPLSSRVKLLRMLKKTKAPQDRTPFGERMFLARTEAGLTQQDVCDKLKISQGTLSEAENSAQGSKHVAQFAALYGVSANWLSTGRGRKRDPVSGPRAPGVAHSMSLSEDTMPELLAWEVVMGGVLPDLFRCAMPDDALKSTTPKGTVLLCSTTAAPVFGKGVIVKDRNGAMHVRRYTQSGAGQWVAEADAPGYASLRPEDGIEVVAAVLAKFDGEV